ncbi:hypothetical protein Y048_6005 [Burkholderia pseudomallei MSHR456]|nr:hypothetical protein Y048_6005 [Burkholderia pseudomallei MSHR456]
MRFESPVLGGVSQARIDTFIVATLTVLIRSTLAFHRTAPFLLETFAENPLTSWHCLLGAAQTACGLR